MLMKICTKSGRHHERENRRDTKQLPTQLIPPTLLGTTAGGNESEGCDASAVAPDDKMVPQFEVAVTMCLPHILLIQSPSVAI